MRRKTAICALVCLSAFFFTAAEEASLLEKRKDIIRYGIESELLDLVTALQTEKEDKLNDDLLGVLTESRSPRLQEALLKFFSVREWGGAIPEAVRLVDGRDEVVASSVNAALGYLAAVRAKEGVPEAREILQSQETKYVSPAIRLLGRAGGEAEAETLLGVFESDEATEATKQDAILALGELRAVAAVDSLIKLLEDESSGKATRMYCADALGKIGDPKAVDALVKAANGDDPQVRSSSVTALGSFKDPAARSAVVQALRDGVTGVRLAAIKSAAAASIREAEPYIRYRARNDPEKKVREEALKALGGFGGGENLDLLREILQDKKSSVDSRTASFSVLLEKDPNGSRRELDKVLSAESTGKDKSLYKAFLRALSQTKEEGAAPLVETYLLRSEDHADRMAGIEWARRNKVRSLRPLIAAMAETDKAEAVKKRAAAALEDF